MNNDIILVVMIKNEEAIIGRCFEHAYKCGVRKMMLCPNGTTDKSVEIIEKFYESHPDVTGYVEWLKWEGFGKTRSASFNVGRKYAEYVMVLDADMCLVRDGEVPKFPPDEPGFLMEQRNHGSSYLNVRIMKSSLSWKCIGRTHEIWMYDPPPRGKIDQLWIDDRDDGGSKSDKFERDVKLLEEDLAEKPNDARTLFYLGNSYDAIGKQDKAIECWKKRINHPTDQFEEEKWMALYYIGKAYCGIANNVKEDLDQMNNLHRKISAEEKEKRFKEIMKKIKQTKKGEEKKKLAEDLAALQAMPVRTEEEEEEFKALLVDSPDYESEKEIKEHLVDQFTGMAVKTMLDAYERRPKRIEPIHYLSHLYRIQGKNRVSYDFAKIAEKIKRPTDELLFIDDVAYRWGPKEELSIVSYYVGQIKEGLANIDALVLGDGVPGQMRDMALTNRSHYLERLGGFKGDRKYYFRDIVPLPGHYVYSSPSIVPNGDGYIVNLRAVNYIIKERGDYVYRGNDDAIRTRNFIIHLDADFSLRGKPIEVVPPKDFVKIDHTVKGWEDIRLFWVGERLFGSFTSLEVRSAPAMCLAELDTTTFEVKKVVDMNGYKDDECQKNWMPFSDRSPDYLKPRFVYGWSPFTVVEVDPETGKVEVVVQKSFKIGTSSWRGSTQLLKDDKGNWISIIHEVGMRERRIYYHRFVRLSPSFDLAGWSDAKFFDKVDIEYCIGFIPEKTRYVITHSVLDDNAQLRILTPLF